MLVFNRACLLGSELNSFSIEKSNDLSYLNLYLWSALTTIYKELLKKVIYIGK